MTDNIDDFIDLENHFESYKSQPGKINPRDEKMLHLTYDVFSSEKGTEWLKMITEKINLEISKESGNNLGYKLANHQGKLQLIADIATQIFFYESTKVNRG